MSKVRLSVDYLSVVDGKRQDDSSSRGDRWAARQRSRRSGIAIVESGGVLRFKPDRGTLVVLAEPDLAGGVDAGPLVADWIASAFAEDSSRSITSSLTHALQSADRQLTKENLKSLSSDRRSVAVVCAVARGDDLYLAQVGSTLALRLRDGELAIIGEVPPSEPISFACTLGQDCEIDIHLCRESVRPGDVVVLSSTALLRIASGREIARCLQRGNSREIVDSLFHVYETSLSPEDFSAVIMVLDDSRLDARRGRSARKDVDESADHPDLDLPRKHEQPGKEMARRPVERVSRSRIGHKDPAELEEDWREPSRVPDHIPSPIKPLRANRAARTRGRKIEPKRILMFAVLPILLFAVASSCAFFLVRGYQAVEQREQAQSILQKSEQLEKEAQSAQDAVLKRRLLAEADKLAAEAAAAKPDDASISATRDRIRNQLDQLSNTVRLTSARKLVDLGQEVKGSNPAKLIVQGIDLYILDKGSDRLYKYLLDASGDQLQPNANPVIVKGRDRIGDAVVGRLVAIAWVPPGGLRVRGALLFVDDGGNVYEYDPGRGLAALKVAGNLRPDAIQAIGGYAGSLYVLAPKQNQLVWFPPAGQGYEKGPYNYVNPDAKVDLSTAIDFVVDSSLFVLHSTGRVDRFYAGRPQQFDGSAADLPMKSATAIYASPSTNSVYVVDAGNQRVVQFSRDGHFERQFRYRGSDNVFNNLKGISIDEKRGKLYILNDRKVFVADVPK